MKYLNQLYARGEDVGAARAAVYGTIFYQSLPKGSGSLPRCRRALKGSVKYEPPTSADPTPVEAASVLVAHLVKSGEPAKILAGLAFITAFDLHTRPSETLEILREDVARRG